MSSKDILKAYAAKFTVSELKTVLSFAKQARYSPEGKKAELLERVNHLILYYTEIVDSKIKEIYKSKAGRSAYTFESESENSDVEPVPTSSKMQQDRLRDLKFADHPFYDVLSVLKGPEPLANSGSQRMYFRLSEKESRLCASVNYHVILRFFVRDTSCVQFDDIPITDFTVMVNSRELDDVPKVQRSHVGHKGKRRSRPLEISKLIYPRSCENIVCFQMNKPLEKKYVVQILLARKLTSEHLLRKLIERKPIPKSTSTKMIVERMTKGAADCMQAEERASLRCAFSKVRMTYPCRGINCKHLPLFDAQTFLQMNEKTLQKMICTCSAVLQFKELALDELMCEIVKNAPADCMQVSFDAAGHWTPSYVAEKLATSPDAISIDVEEDEVIDAENNPYLDRWDLLQKFVSDEDFELPPFKFEDLGICKPPPQPAAAKMPPGKAPQKVVKTEVAEEQSAPEEESIILLD